LPVISINEALPSCSTFAHKMFVQKSDVREKELANDVSVESDIVNRIVFHKSFSIFLWNIFTDFLCERERVSWWCKCKEFHIVCAWSLKTLSLFVLLSYIL